MARNLLTSFSCGGQQSAITGTLENSCMHAYSNGNLSSAIIFIACISSNTGTKLASQPKEISTIPIPKNCFPSSSSSKSFRLSIAGAKAHASPFLPLTNASHFDGITSTSKDKCAKMHAHSKFTYSPVIYIPCRHQILPRSEQRLSPLDLLETRDLLPGFFNIFKDYKRFNNRFSVMNKDWNLFCELDCIGQVKGSCW